MQPEHTSRPGIQIDGVFYYTASQVAEAAGVSRQTIWRWRTRGKIPQGQRYRDQAIVFTEDELHTIKQYAHRLAPADTPSNDLPSN